MRPVYHEIRGFCIFVYSIAKRARKYYLALTTATQDVQDFLSTDYGKAVLSNSSIQMLLKQSPTEVDQISEIFYLSQGEKELLLSADVGEGLFFAGQSHVVIKVIAAPFEHTIITSNPQEILAQKQKSEENTLPDAPVATIPSAVEERPQVPGTIPVVGTTTVNSTDPTPAPNPVRPPTPIVNPVAPPPPETPPVT